MSAALERAREKVRELGLDDGEGNLAYIGALEGELLELERLAQASEAVLGEVVLLAELWRRSSSSRVRQLGADLLGVAAPE